MEQDALEACQPTAWVTDDNATDDTDRSRTARTSTRAIRASAADSAHTNWRLPASNKGLVPGSRRDTESKTEAMGEGDIAASAEALDRVGDVDGETGDRNEKTAVEDIETVADELDVDDNDLDDKDVADDVAVEVGKNVEDADDDEDIANNNKLEYEEDIVGKEVDEVDAVVDKEDITG